MSQPIYRFADLEVDPAAFELRRNGEALPVEPRTVELLICLLDAGGDLVSREDLFRRVLGAEFASEDALFKTVQRARQAVGDDGRRQEIIKTVPGRGYRFAAPFRVAPREQDPSAGGQPNHPARPASPPGAAPFDEVVSADPPKTPPIREAVPEPSTEGFRPTRVRRRPLFFAAAGVALAATLTVLGISGLETDDAADQPGATEDREPGALAAPLSGAVEQPRSRPFDQSFAGLPASADVARLVLEGQRQLEILRAESAAGLFQQAIDGDPQYHRAWEGLARARFELGDPDSAQLAAQAALDRVKELRTLPRAVVISAEALHREVTGQLDEAQRLYQSVWSFDAENPEAGLAVTRCQIRRGDQRALQTLRRVQDLHLREPTRPEFDLSLTLLEARAHRLAGSFELQSQAADRAGVIAREQEWRQAEIEALLLRADATQQLGETETAAALLEQAASMASEIGWQRGRLQVDLALAQLLTKSERQEQAEAQLADVVQRALDANDRRILVEALRSQAHLALVARRLEESVELADHALQLSRSFGQLGQEAALLRANGDALADLTRFDEAQRNYDEARQIFAKLDDLRGLANIRSSLGLVYRMSGKPAAAVEELNAAVRLYQQLGQPLRESLVLYNLASLNIDSCHLQEAREQLERSLEIEREARKQSGVAWALHGLALVHFEDLNLPSALEHADRAIALREDLGDAAGRTGSSLRRALILEFMDRPAEALEVIDHELDESLVEPSSTRVLALQLRALALLPLGRLDEADQALDDAEITQQTIGVAHADRRGLLFRGQIALQRGDLDGARRAFEAARDAGERDNGPFIRLSAKQYLLEIDRRTGAAPMAELVGQGRALLAESDRLGCKRPSQQIREWLDHFG